VAADDDTKAVLARAGAIKSELEAERAKPSPDAARIDALEAQLAETYDELKRLDDAQRAKERAEKAAEDAAKAAKAPKAAPVPTPENVAPGPTPHVDKKPAPPPPATTPAPPSTDKVAARSPVDLGHPGKPPPWWKSLRVDPPFYFRIAIGGAMIFFVFFIWWFVTRGDKPEDAIISPVKLPSPGKVFGATGEVVDRDLEGNLYATLWRVGLSVFYAAVVGIGLGVIAGSIRAVAAAVNPLVLFLRSIPMGALLPVVFVLFVGDTAKQKTMFLFLAVVPFVFSDTVKAITSVPQRYVETAETLGASNRQVITKVLVPLAIPDIITSLRFQFGLALGYVMLAEGFLLEKGIGSMMVVSERQSGRFGHHTYFLLFVLVAVALVIDLTLKYIQRYAFPYRKDLS
jgi:ABC-type nitrate/sulfonate/bicarbonate transport system permease component